ncbi:hypothetical protein [Polyangium sorediatum]|uniref:Lipoprotein n=1 Tax=Polyangium sorediatum TaxID=889274 RepID=A0ABT6P2N8_9BACT|nr:hypothetical protein [Polyangium sorediatum]MDI1434510.1 hypothetical protein [Polyangium sorediatum]
MKRARAVIVSVVLGSLLGGSSGCYRYSWQARGDPGLTDVPVDAYNPRSATRWSYVWGLLQDKWAPTDCAGDGTARPCSNQIPICGGRPVGRVDTAFSVGSALLMFLTLGMAVPEHVTIYCSTAGTISVPPVKPPPPPPPEGRRR